jgi:RNA polymerase sigma-70 factor (ECF subfamily)
MVVTHRGMSSGFSIVLSIRGVSLYPWAMRGLTSLPEEEAALVRRIAAAAPERDAAAEAEICRRFAPRVRLFGLRHLRNHAAAADLAQEVLIITLEKLRAGGLRDAERLGAFVLGTARQCIVDWRRNKTRRDRILGTFPIDLPSLIEEGPELLDTDRLRACLHGLPQREHTVLLMTFYDDHSAEAVGAELGLSAANVRVIRHRGIQRLRDCMNLDRELA